MQTLVYATWPIYTRHNEATSSEILHFRPSRFARTYIADA